jgi:hypothetical protein
MFGQERSSPERAARVRTLKEWTREALNLPEDAVILATELRCTEPGCPPLETVVAVMRVGDDRQQFKIHKPISDVVYEDIEDGAARMLRGEAHAHAQRAEDGEDASDDAPPTKRPNPHAER